MRARDMSSTFLSRNQRLHHSKRSDASSLPQAVVDAAGPGGPSIMGALSAPPVQDGLEALSHSTLQRVRAVGRRRKEVPSGRGRQHGATTIVSADPQAGSALNSVAMSPAETSIPIASADLLPAELLPADEARIDGEGAPAYSVAIGSGGMPLPDGELEASPDPRDVGHAEVSADEADYADEPDAFEECEQRSRCAKSFLCLFGCLFSRSSRPPLLRNVHNPSRARRKLLDDSTPGTSAERRYSSIKREHHVRELAHAC
mmetsp:Transcript_48443/g.109140  ORF Transcript_48443/g.109140 Transcript_48443/m.109140 type:complete len:259 (-) Transcript_48443:263-1039(-)